MLCCPTWPLALQFINYDVLALSEADTRFYFGPPQSSGKPLAWVIFNAVFSVDTILSLTGVYVKAWLQWNTAHQQRAAQGLTPFGSWRFDQQRNFPLVGGAPFADDWGGIPDAKQVEMRPGQARPLYLVHPNELVIQTPATGFDDGETPPLPVPTPCHFRAWVLEVPADVDVSLFL